MAFLTPYVLPMIFSVIWLSRRQYCWTKLLLVSCSIGLKNVPDGVPDFADRLTRAECPRFAYLVKRALMRKSGLSPVDISKQFPLGEEYSSTMREYDIDALASISDDFYPGV